MSDVLFTLLTNEGTKKKLNIVSPKYSSTLTNIHIYTEVLEMLRLIYK